MLKFIKNFFKKNDIQDAIYLHKKRIYEIYQNEINNDYIKKMDIKDNDENFTLISKYLIKKIQNDNMDFIMYIENIFKKLNKNGNYIQVDYSGITLKYIKKNTTKYNNDSLVLNLFVTVLQKKLGELNNIIDIFYLNNETSKKIIIVVNDNERNIKYNIEYHFDVILYKDQLIEHLLKQL